MGAVIDRGFERPPEEELVEAAEAAIGIAADEIDVHGFEIGGRIARRPMMVSAKAVNMRHEDRLDAIGIGLAQCIGPFAVGRRPDPPRRIALDMARRFGKLQPENRGAVRAARGIERGRLADANGRRFGQHAALGFVRRFRYAIEARGQMQERHFLEAPAFSISADDLSA